MLLTLFTETGITSTSLSEVSGGMQWLKASDAANAKRYGLIEPKDNGWLLSARRGMQLFDEKGKICDHAVIDAEVQASYTLRDKESSASVFIRPTAEGDKTFMTIGFKTDEVLTFGSSSDNTFCYPSRFVSRHHARLDYVRDVFSVTDLASSNGTFVNGRRLARNETCELGVTDIVQILGLVFMVGHRFVNINNPADILDIHTTSNFVYFELFPCEPPDVSTYDEHSNQDFFYPAPRFKRDIAPVALSVDAPPAPSKPDETPLVMKIGPSMVMALAAVFSGAALFTRMMEQGGSVVSAAPMLAVAVSMVAGSVLWPIFSKRFEKKKADRAEALRRQTYAVYLDSVRMRLRDETDLQKEILEENRLTMSECIKRAYDHDARLMDRTSAHADFLELRLGTGTLPLAADIRYPDEHFVVEQDALMQVVYRFSREPKNIQDAPIAINLVKNSVAGFVGEPAVIRSLVFGLVIQIACLHSYEEVKIALFCDEEERKAWDWAVALPHMFSDDCSCRFCATTLDEAAEVGLMLEHVAVERREKKNSDMICPVPHYVVVCVSKNLTDKADFVGSLSKHPTPGFSLVCVADERKDLPKQCTSIIEVDGAEASMRKKDDISGTALMFSPDIGVSEPVCKQVSQALAVIRLDVASVKSALPDKVGFLEMYQAGSLNQLGVRKRWEEAKGSSTLAACVGLDSAGEPFILNLHEKFHGPHGLIAGTTGSGKSELIITWILSMCVEYSPEEVSFVLIDYKGGGLASAFENERMCLPHVAGTITNLDGAAIARSLVSIKSELTRRQALFNEVRQVAAGDNVDIYKYLSLYHEKKVAKPCPHLFIVADEFAELKQQEPEFMTELMSAARIGRSLGVHLVLATQKPTGVVNDQIWSNSKFKICLKVADAADSKEMIKRMDAAELANVGRFYLLVGYNELFALGQSAYTGVPYTPCDQFMPARDDAVTLISNTGRILAEAHPARATQAGDAEPVSELVAVSDHISEVGRVSHLSCDRLWLAPLPGHITLDDLSLKYPRDQEDSFVLEPIVGEIDDPANQSQRLLALPLTRGGNAVVYGSAGSGTEAILATMLASLLRSHSAHTLHAYILDLAAETLSAFSGAPHVGDVVLSGDGERIENLFKMLETEMSRRKKRLSNYGGDRERLREKTGQIMPSILVVLHGFEQFAERYECQMPLFIELSRDGVRYGMSFLITATRANGVSYRVLPNFKQKLACALSSRDEYTGIFGALKGAVPPEGYARGLIKEEGVLLEFQGARVNLPGESEYEAIRELVENLAPASDQSSAAGIPVLPANVSADTFAGRSLSPSQVPVGLVKDTLEVVSFDFESEPSWMISGNDRDLFFPILKEIAVELEARGMPYVMLDATGTFEKTLPDAAMLQSLFSSDKKDASARAIVLIPSLSALQSLCDQQSFTSMKNYIESSLYARGHGFIVCDEAPDFTSFGIAPWYKKLSGKGNGIWVGNGITGQMLFKMARIGVRFDEDPPVGMGYFIYKNTASYIKHLRHEDAEEDAS